MPAAKEFGDTIDEVCDWLKDVEDRLARMPLPDGSARTMDQIAMAAPSVLAAAYRDWNHDITIETLGGISKSLEMISVSMPS